MASKLNNRFKKPENIEVPHLPPHWALADLFDPLCIRIYIIFKLNLKVVVSNFHKNPSYSKSFRGTKPKNLSSRNLVHRIILCSKWLGHWHIRTDLREVSFKQSWNDPERVALKESHNYRVEIRSNHTDSWRVCCSYIQTKTLHCVMAAVLRRCDITDLKLQNRTPPAKSEDTRCGSGKEKSNVASCFNFFQLRFFFFGWNDLSTVVSAED